MASESVLVELGDDGVAIFTLNNPPMNTLHPKVARCLMMKFEEAHKRPDVKAIVLTGSNGIFCGGADIRSMSASSNREEVPRTTCDVIEGGPQPVVAAISRYAFGGGLELALACHARVAAPGSRLGLSELRFGLIPGLGGTQRLPRLVGVKKALHMMLNIELLNTEEAYAAGLIDLICDPLHLIESARMVALALVNQTLKRSLERTDRLEPAKGIPKIIAAARVLAKEIHPHVQHPFLCIHAVEQGLLKGGVEGSLLERRLMLSTLTSPVAKALMHVFLAERSAFKVPGAASSQKMPVIKSAGVVGAGTLGSQVATALILSGIRVHLKDSDGKRLQAGLARVEMNLRTRTRDVSGDGIQKVMQLLVGNLDYDGFDNLPLVIEVVSEPLQVKKQILLDLDKLCPRSCILASNTPATDIDATLGDISHPGRILSAEFFSPPFIRLVQLVGARETSMQTIQNMLSVCKTINKVAVVVNDKAGFGVHRAFLPYMTGALFLVDVGVDPYRIDRIMEGFGMSMGPFRLHDIVGIHAHSSLLANSGERVYTSPLTKLLVEGNRTGMSAGRGYYNYTPERQPAPELDEYLKKSRHIANFQFQDKIEDQEILEMVFFPAVNEACRLVEEGIFLRASDLDVASIYGLGFPSFRGGLLFWACHTVGLNPILSKLSAWQLLYGPYFRPTPALHKCVACGANMVPRL